MADSLSFEFMGVAEFIAALDVLGEEMSKATRKGLVKSGGKLEARAKQNASGRPGPNVVSGNNRRGIGVVVQPRPWGAHGWEMQLGPTMIYSRRIELGWHGSMTYPFFGPAFQLTPADLQRDLYDAWAEVAA
jgi:hypothetical protein